MDKQEFFNRAIPAALASGHIWPEHAACEAALESAWGKSRLAVEASNLFGQKQGFSTEHFDTVAIRTHEVLTSEQMVKVVVWPYGQPTLRPDGKFDCMVPATWPKFPDWEWSFRQRMIVLQRVPALYGAALSAKDGETFVREVSKHWATDPQRAEKVMATYRANLQLIANAKTLMYAAKKAGA